MLEIFLIILFSRFPTHPPPFAPPKDIPIKCARGQICLQIPFTNVPGKNKNRLR